MAHFLLLWSSSFWTISPPQFPQQRQQQKQKPTIGTIIANKKPIPNTTRKGNSQPSKNYKTIQNIDNFNIIYTIKLYNYNNLQTCKQFVNVCNNLVSHTVL